MAAAEENNKWRYADSEEQGSTPQPPHKKRFMASTSSSSSSPSQSIEGDSRDESTDSLNEPLEAFRRDAIVRQWKEYKRSGKRWKSRAVASEQRARSSEEALGVWDAQFQQLRKALKDLVRDESFESLKNSMQRADEDGDNMECDTVFDTLSDDAPTMSRVVQSPMEKPSELHHLFNAWQCSREKLADNLKQSLSIDPSAREQYETTIKEWVENQQSLRDAQARLAATQMKSFILDEELQLLMRRIASTDETIRDARLELINAENRLSSKNESPDVVMDEAEKRNAEEGSSSTTKQATPEQNSQTTTEETREPPDQEPLVRTQQEMDRQLQEIEAIKDQRIELKQQRTRLQIDMVCLPENRIRDAPLIRELYDALRDMQRDKKNSRAADDVRDLQKELADLQSTQRKFIAELDAKQVDEIKEQQKGLWKLDKDLNQVRGQRDALQVQADEFKAYGNSVRASTAEVKLIADTRKERAATMESELYRLQRRSIAMTGDRALYALAKSLPGDFSIESLREQVSALERELREKKAQVCRNVTSEELDQEILTVVEHKRLCGQANEFKENYGFDVGCTDESEAIAVMESKLTSDESKIGEARERLNSFEVTERQLLSEIDSVSKVYSELDEQNMAKVKELMALEDEIYRLQSERSKHSQAFTYLNKSKDANTMVANALKKQNEKELAYIKELNEREKNMNSHLATLERELNASKAALTIYEQKVAELREVLKQLDDKNLQTKASLKELREAILDKTAQIEQGAHERLRLEENRELLRRKLEAVTKVENPAEMKLRKEKEEYRALLNCSSCGSHLKSHVLMRCMHTFCKDCLDVRIETRQRRCPSCGESFGINDVKQFYF